MILLTISRTTSTRIAEIGFVFAAIAGAVLALVAAAPSVNRAWGILGGIALAAGSVLVIIAIHWGTFA